MRISATSVWDDEIWKFPNSTAGQREESSWIRWNRSLPGGSRLIDKPWIVLLETFRWIAWYLFCSPFGSRLKVGSAYDFERSMMYFACWMVEEDYACLSEIDEAGYEDFISSLVVDKIEDAHSTATARSLLRYLMMPEYIRSHAVELRNIGLPVPPVTPYKGISPFDVAKQLAEDSLGQFPPLPDEIAIAALNAAVRVLDASDDNIGATNHFIGKAPPYTLTNEKARLSFIKKFLNDCSVKFPQAYPFIAERRQWKLRSAVAALRDSCLIIIQACVGLRGSELCGLEPGKSQNGLPGCVKVVPSLSGLHEIFLIRGRIYKGKKEWTEHEWVAGARPVGSDYLPLPVRAVKVLEELLRPFRKSLKLNKLALKFSVTMPGWLDVNFSNMRTDDLRRGQKLFFRDRVAGHEWNIIPSQWRKTYAQFVTRYDERLLPELRDQFGHLHIALTDQGYASVDPEMRQFLDDASVGYAVTYMGEIATGSKRTEGDLVPLIRKAASQVSHRFGNKSNEDARTDFDRGVRDVGLKVCDLRFSGKAAGKCVYRPGTGCCTEGCLARWVMPVPLWSAAEPDVCWECENLALSEEHLDFWMSRFRKYSASYEQCVALGDTANAFMCRKRMAQSLMVLGKFGIDPLTKAPDENE